jgi:elongation factor Ts
MTVISAESVRQLREATGAGMMDCKKALVETANEFEAAVAWLRTKGLAAAAKKSDRTAAEGLVGLSTKGTEGALVEVNAETDFIASNDEFQALVADAAALAVASKADVEAIKAGKTRDGSTVQERLTHLIAKIGENMQVRRAIYLNVSQGVVAGYIHNAAAPGLGRMGVLVALESPLGSGEHAADLEALGRQVAMHVAAANPQSLSPEDLSPEVVEREKAIFRDQAASSGKSAEVAEKMVVGRLQKFYEESVLLEQSFVMDPSLKVKDHIQAFAAKHGASVKLVAFKRFVLGEGIEKAVSNFAEEVAAQLRA